MFKSNTHTDPIVQILILAYRRGLALRREEDARKTPYMKVVARNCPDDQDGLKVEETVIVEEPDS